MIDINLHTNTQIYNPITGAQKINPAKSKIKKRKPKEERREKKKTSKFEGERL